MYNTKIKGPLLFLIAMLAAWLGMTWWSRSDREPGETPREQSTLPETPAGS